MEEKLSQITLADVKNDVASCIEKSSRKELQMISLGLLFYRKKSDVTKKSYKSLM